MCTCTPPSSTMRRASAAYSSGVYGIAGHWSRLASDPEIEQVMTTGSSRLKAAPSAESGKCYFPRTMPAEGRLVKQDRLRRSFQRELCSRVRGYFLGLICPRISPPGFLAVWMLTYVLPARRSLTAVPKFATPAALAKSFLVSLPFLGSVHGFRQMGRMTGPALPFLPKWMWMAWTGPLRPLALIV